MLREYWNYHDRILRPLAFMNGRRIGRYQDVKFAKAVCDWPVVKAHNDLARGRFNVEDIADIAVIDLSLS